MGNMLSTRFKKLSEIFLCEHILQPTLREDIILNDETAEFYSEDTPYPYYLQFSNNKSRFSFKLTPYKIYSSSRL